MQAWMMHFIHLWNFKPRGSFPSVNFCNRMCQVTGKWSM